MRPEIPAHGILLFSSFVLHAPQATVAPMHARCFRRRVIQVYKGPEHPHDAQQPEPLEFGGLTSTPDSRVLKLEDPDAMLCAQ